MDMTERLAVATREELNAFFTGDPWEDNSTLNTWECLHRVVKLESYPPRVYLPIADSCNARCEFCTSWLYKDVFMHPKMLEGFAEVLKRAHYIDLCGYGEPLINPHFLEITRTLERYVDPRCQMILFSNGALLDKWIDRLLDAGITWFAFSLNAATSETHDAVMGLGPKAFEKIIAAMRCLKAQADARGKTIYLTASLIVTATNIHEVADFVDLCNTLPIQTCFVRPLQLDLGHKSLNDHALPPYLDEHFEEHRERAIEALARSKVDVVASPENWDLPLLPPEIEAASRAGTLPVKSRAELARDNQLFYPDLTDDMVLIPPVADPDPASHADNPFDRSAPYDCKYPYEILLIARQQVTLCCYMNEVPGMAPIRFDGSQSFMEIWNGAQMTRVREGLAYGPMVRNCLTCPRNQ